MEKYKFKKDNIFSKSCMIKGDFYNDILTKLNRKFDDESIDIIIDNVDRTYEKILNLKKTKNLLLVGKVQSGKTSNLKLLTGLLFDNDFQLGVIYGGYDSELLKQTSNRFRNIYMDKINDKKILIIDTNTDIVEGLSEVLTKVLKNTKVLIISMKNHQTIKKLTNALSDTDFVKNKTFIIDDEGDQASLNTEFKQHQESSTYKNISDMIDVLNEPIYISSTATPNAIVFQPDSILKPDDVVLIEPGAQYCGADFFHTNRDNIILVDRNIDDNKFSEDLKNAFYHYLLSSAILQIEGVDKTSMIVHTNVKLEEHARIKADFMVIQEHIENLMSVDKPYLVKQFENVYKTPIFEENITNRYNLEHLINLIHKIIPQINFILFNMEGKAEKQYMEYNNYNVAIGSLLLQRGVTFPNLVTTYLTHAPITGGNMDTTLQRARWLGYRRNISHLMKIFTIEELADNFSILTDVEEQLWDQFYEIQDGLYTLDDISISVEDTNMKPSRSNVISIETTAFRRKWYKQNLGFFSKSETDKNNYVINEYLNKFEKKKISLARNDNEINIEFFTDTIDNFKNHIIDRTNIFNFEPLSGLIEYMENHKNKNMKIDILLMDSLKQVPHRERQFTSENKVNNLHQGPGSNRKDSKFLGESKAIRDMNNITIQVFNVLPKKYEPRQELLQYMFAFYLPRKGVYVRAKKND